MKVLLLGGFGFLGQYLSAEMSESGWAIWRQSRSRGDLRFNWEDPQSVSRNLRRLRPDVIVNLIAETSVNACELNPHLAQKAHITIPEVLSDILSGECWDCHLIHISTDQVYSGSGPHVEGKTNPINKYGLTKLAGEKIIKYPAATILRTNFIGMNESGGSSLADWIFASLQRGDAITGFANVLFSPLNVVTLSSLIDMVAQKKKLGVFNIGSTAGYSKYEFARALASGFGYCKNLIEKGEFKNKDEASVAPRPLDMRMDVTLFETQLQTSLPTFEEETEKTIEMFRRKYEIIK